MRVLIFMMSIFMLAGCSFQAPKPWEKGNLSLDRMQLGGGDSLQVQVNEHVFTSKEGSFGGNGVGGGGCGCN